ncbi:MAG: hypothetical protein ACK4KW_06210 [Gemmobacter sp.]
MYAIIYDGMSANLDIGNILFLAERYRAHRNLALSTVSLYATGRGAFLSKLARGDASMTLHRRDRIFAWFGANWPSDLEWPRHIPRPPKTKEAA